MALTKASGKNHTRRIATWTGETTAGDASIPRYAPLVSLAVSSVQVSGASGGATVVLQAIWKIPAPAQFASATASTSGSASPRAANLDLL